MSKSQTWYKVNGTSNVVCLIRVLAFGHCPASPEKRRPSASSRTHSDGPVSQTLLTSDFKRRELLRAFATLDDSQTPTQVLHNTSVVV